MKESVETLAYMAGIIDGEGYIGIIARTRGYLLSLHINNTSENIINWIAGHFGGRSNSYQPSSPNNKRMYSWQATGQRAKDVIWQVQPYLVIKSEHANIALNFPIGNQWHIFTTNEIALRQSSYERIRSLNAKGVH